MTAGETHGRPRRDLEVEVMQGRKLAVEVVAPIREDRIELDVLGDAEEQVDVGPSVLSASRRGAGHRSARDPRVLLGELEQLPSQRFPMIAGEHPVESIWRVAEARWSSTWCPAGACARGRCVRLSTVSSSRPRRGCRGLRAATETLYLTWRRPLARPGRQGAADIVDAPAPPAARAPPKRSFRSALLGTPGLLCVKICPPVRVRFPAEPDSTLTAPASAMLPT